MEHSRRVIWIISFMVLVCVIIAVYFFMHFNEYFQSTMEMEDSDLSEKKKDIQKIFKESSTEHKNAVITDYVYADDKAYGLDGVVQYTDETGCLWKLAFVRSGVVHTVSQEWGKEYQTAGKLAYVGNGQVQVLLENTEDGSRHLCSLTYSYDPEKKQTHFVSSSEKQEK